MGRSGEASAAQIDQKKFQEHSKGFFENQEQWFVKAISVAARAPEGRRQRNK